MKNLIFLLFVIWCLGFGASAHAQSIDLLYQGDGYTPPFYAGRTLWSSQSRLTLVAIPSGLGNAQSLSYRWVKNGTVLGSLSGQGKNTLALSDTILSKTQTIRVEVLNRDDYEAPILAAQSLVLTPITPEILVYENNPLYGYMFHKGIDNLYNLTGAEVTLKASPLFFNLNNLNYHWQTNTGVVEVKDSVTYRIPEGSKGSSQVEVHVSNAGKILQDARKNFLVQFGTE